MKYDANGKLLPPHVVVKPGKWVVSNKDTGIESEIDYDYLQLTLNKGYLEIV